ncbi:right-handed parallel beta-helix repeat-containing protein [Massilia sp. CF038]|uniref:right-handed parallel beta-helix repeat-containing protein n=1 Tax=Massilia sp. CF038 TaxID=1881045 RepID=UPI000911A568|nr:right-handed parallel beta-helix repeat-containing protein [Massilia sp. CF038]SHG73865.1 Protein of unknown function [Massilia sp. CF038]
MKQAMLCMMMTAATLTACGGAAVPEPGPDSAPAPVLLATTESDAVAEDDAAADASGDGAADPGDFVLQGYGPALTAKGDAAAPASTLHVSPKGDDANPGTASRPFRSLARAVRAATPGTRVLVAAGTYQGGVRSRQSGRPDARIVFVSAQRWGAKIVPPKNSPNKTAWDNRGSDVDIVGFEVDGSNYQGGKRWTLGIYSGGSHVVIRNNHVHHLAQSGCTPAGGAAIGVDSYYGGVASSVLANLVHDIGVPGCRFVQGIYVSTSGEVKNNAIYRVAEAGIHLWHDAHDVIITNNTVTASNTGIIVGGGNFYRTKGPNDRTAVYSNIVYDNRMGISEQGKTGPNNSYRNNLVYQNSRYDWHLKNGLRHNDTVSAAPLFVADGRSARPNLRLQRLSPAIGKATPAQADSTDFEGKPRNAGAGFDIGAFQH